jgi:ribonuclease HI
MNSLFDLLENPESTASIASAILYCDGGSRGNPGPSGSGAVLFDEEGREIARTGEFSGTQTNNFAEYRGLILGLELALAKNISHLQVRLDSQLIVRQMNGQYKVKNAGLKPLFEKSKQLEISFSGITFIHVPRDQNKVADSIANQYMDRRT